MFTCKIQDSHSKLHHQALFLIADFFTKYDKMKEQILKVKANVSKKATPLKRETPNNTPASTHTHTHQAHAYKHINTTNTCKFIRI